MEKFAFLSHPLDLTGLMPAFPWTRYIPGYFIRKLTNQVPLFKIKKVLPGEDDSPSGLLIISPVTAPDLLRIPSKTVFRRILHAGIKAQKAGAQVFGCGLYSSIGRDAFSEIAAKMSIPVITGEAFCIAAAIEGLKLASRKRGLDISSLKATVVGACGPVGSVLAELLARETRSVCLVGNDQEKLNRTANKILYDTGTVALVNPSFSASFKKTDIVIFDPYYKDYKSIAELLEPNAIVCDISRERFALNQIASTRDDVLLIEGGNVEYPEQVTINSLPDYQFLDLNPSLAETMIMAMDRKKDVNKADNLSILTVERISKLARKYGFRVTGFRVFKNVLKDFIFDLKGV